MLGATSGRNSVRSAHIQTPSLALSSRARLKGGNKSPRLEVQRRGRLPPGQN